MSYLGEKNRIAYNKIADDYDNTRDGKFTRKFKRLLAAEMDFSGVSTVLDVGCGNGALLKTLHERNENFSGFGVDVSDNMIRHAAAANPGMEFHVAECHAMPFGDSIMDRLTVCAAYHHFPDVAAFAKEASRVLKTLGKLMIADIYLPALIIEMVNPFLPILPGNNYALYTPRQITANLRSHGFGITSVKLYGYIQLVTAQKKTRIDDTSFRRTV
ncbi:MAG: methyltransferase domain-containing protein [Defluviitaleaceae bacterium]|nr:methyltransferase domain-containing protein [Defluviitaleaceae bacterium]